jgi:hypothetical protein
MDGQRARLVARQLDRVPAITRSDSSALRDEPAGHRRRSIPAFARLTTPWAAALGLGWPLAIITMIALEPAPADPGAPVPIVVEVGGLALYAALLMTAVAAGMRHRAAAGAATVAGLIAVTFTVACPVSGHHTYAPWWFAQLAVAAGMLAVSLAALARRAAT